MDEALDHFGAVVVGAPGLVGFQHCELGAVGGIHALVTEVAVDLKDAFHATNHAPLEVQLGGDAQVEIDIQGVGMGDKRPGRRTTVQGLQHGGFHL